MDFEQNRVEDMEQNEFMDEVNAPAEEPSDENEINAEEEIQTAAGEDEDTALQEAAGFFRDGLERFENLVSVCKPYRLKKGYTLVKMDDLRFLNRLLHDNIPEAVQYGWYVQDRVNDLLQSAEAKNKELISEAETRYKIKIMNANEQSDQILADAKGEAEAIVTQAREDAAYMVSEDEIVREAKAEATRIRAEARNAADEIRAKAESEARAMLGDLRKQIEQTLRNVDKMSNDVLNAFASRD